MNRKTRRTADHHLRGLLAAPARDRYEGRHTRYYQPARAALDKARVLERAEYDARLAEALRMPSAANVPTPGQRARRVLTIYQRELRATAMRMALGGV